MKEQEPGATGPAPPPKTPGALRKALRWTVLSVGGALGAAILIVAAFVIFRIPIDLSGLRGTAERLASEATGRVVGIDGAITLRPAPWPTVRIEGVRMGNPRGWPEGDFASLDSARAQVGILRLLKGEIRVGEIGIDGLRVRMDVNAEGEANWLFEAPGEAPAPEPELREEAGDTAPALRFVEFERLELRDMSVTYRDARTGEVFEATFDEVSGGAGHLEPMELFINGTARAAPFSVKLTGGSLDAFIYGEEPWPIELVTEIAGTNLTVAGEVRDPMRRAEIDLDFDFQGPAVKNLENLLGTALPPIRSFALQGHMNGAAGLFRIDGLKGSAGDTEFTGGLVADATGERPRLTGSLDIRSIDAGPLSAALDTLEDEQPAAAEPAREPAKPQGPAAPRDPLDLDEPVLILDPLRTFDAEFNVTIHEVANSPIGLRDASLKTVVADGGLTALMAVTVADVPFAGEIRVAPDTGGTPAVDVSLSAARADIGELARLLLNAEGVEGGFETAEVSFSARGETIRLLAESAELRSSIAAASLSYGNVAGGRPVKFTLDAADMVMPALDRSRIAARGTLLGEPFSLQASGGNFLDSYVDRKWPLELSATGGGARLRVDGTVVGDRHGVGTSLNFDLSGRRIGGLAAWTGVSPRARERYRLRGGFAITGVEKRLSIREARIGDTALSGDVGVRREGEDVVSFVDVRATVIDARQLAGLAPASDERTGSTAKAQPSEPPEQPAPPARRQQLAIDVPIMPYGIEIFDTDIDVAIDRIKLDPADVTGVAFSTKVRDGHVERAPFRATVAGATLAGTMAADLRGADPAVDLVLRSEDVNVGTLLEYLGVAEGLDLTAGRFDLRLAMRGASTREILERSEFSAGIRNGRWTIKDPNMEGVVDIAVSEATIGARRGKPVTLSLDGRLDAARLKITLTTDSLASFANRKDKLRMDLGVAMPGTDLRLTGTAPLPVQADDLHFTLDLSGEKLSGVNDLLNVSLPPIGPYRLTGDFGSRASGYYVDKLRLKVAGSTLNGTLDFSTASHPPRLTVDLDAERIQLDDFDTGAWSPLDESETPAPVDRTARKAAAAQRTVKKARAVLSPEVMRAIDARLTLDVREVLSGQDPLGRGSLVATLEDGRAQVDPLILDIPGGSVNVGFALEPTATDVGLEARASIDRLDYGILARRIDPASVVGGIISADVDLTTRGRDLDNVMDASNGHIDFAIWPKNLDARLFDLWAVNLFVAMMPSLDSETRSKVNCLVARFNLRDGIMRPSALLIDSTNIQASGDGVIDFRSDTIDFRAVPEPKRPQMFSARTPVRVRGRIPDIKVALGTGAIIGTIIRMVTSPVVVPFQWIFTESEPADGQAACQRAWGRPPPGPTPAG